MLTLLIIMSLMCAATHLFLDIRRRNEIETIKAIHQVQMFDISSRAYAAGRKLGARPEKKIIQLPVDVHH